MKRLILIAITCVVVDQTRSGFGWLTKCKGIEVDGEVVFDREIKNGKAVSYRPFVMKDDEQMHGTIMDIGEATKAPEPVIESSDSGKLSQ